ncbi:mechanosensitive ion channel family protein [Ruegeria arenilitoris]|nr:mechanosensitive ion channel family protein [Ruegeria arenilitoris]
MKMIKSLISVVASRLLASLLCVSLLTSQTSAQAITEEVDPDAALPPVLTHTPYHTLQTLQNLHDELVEANANYSQEKSSQNYHRIELLADALISLLDVSAENTATRRDSSLRTILALIDIIEQVDPAEFVVLPDHTVDLSEIADYYPVPSTPLILQRVDAGPREGEFLFSANSSKIAPRYLREIATQTPERLDELWSTRLMQFSGPWIPAALERSLPDISKGLYWGTPLWKIVFAFLSLAFVMSVLIWLKSAVKRRVVAGEIRASTGRLIRSGSTVILIYLLNKFFNYQLFLTGSFARTETFIATAVIYGALAWTFWNFMEYMSDKIAARRMSSDRSSDDSMMRLLNHIIALVGVIWILAFGAQTMGFPLLSILAGLGVGGLAVALAIRPTLENLISGFVLYLEKSVRVGDYCSFGGQAGTVERIGVRSTHVRALDRTLIAIPNSKFVDMELVNWAQCDEMLINSVIGLRYETDTDQLRFVLAEIRKMMHGHPRIKSETARVRFVGYGASSLDIDVRVYAQTREWNDFYAIREDVFFRIKEIVEASGTGFAFPSQTVYLSKDAGLDAAKSKATVEEVGRWRYKRQLPFPNFSSQVRERLEGTLRYPPRGSPEYFGPEEETAKVTEPLSASPTEDQPADETNAQPDDDGKPGDSGKTS